MTMILDGSTGATLPVPLTVANGGTGAASATAYAVQCGGTTSTGAHQSIASVGTSGQVLTSNGAGALPTFQTASPIPTMDVKTSGTSATWTIPTGVTKVRITVVAGGGSGAGVESGAFNMGSGGAGGGTAIKVLTGLTPGNTLTYTVGTGGAQASNAGNSGNTSQVASGTQTITTISATGGGGGKQLNPGTSASEISGGIGSNGDLNIKGQGGFMGSDTSSGGGGIYPGPGGSSFLGGGAAGAANSSGANGQAGGAYGSGGAGGYSGNSPGTRSGGAGAAGVIIFEY
jgi:hypothetical protein